MELPHGTRNSIADVAYQVGLLILGLFSLYVMFWTAVTIDGLFYWVGDLIGGALLLVLARFVPIDPRARVLRWIVAGTGLTMVVIGMITAVAILRN